ncbi:glycine--tRNA ligase subunit beta [Lyngbya confervoides]|uniref:Glycine--tRNA ligase beta subunit n=1 Tax=Lyngbya confervoides BDU141951 TaxID=1574623 RepID=A0ABD4T5Q6_9CYAN|nr:glycine--tRNA ligase subunit beta [Lyngbya confervoides]MCM1984047.1 glycine--tRNA ligase subunit beta [Lyngbya confervoides BDU141951]
MTNFLLEVGVEELPAQFVASALAQWQQRIPQSLSDHLLTAQTIQVYGTPRRLAVLIEGLPEQQPQQREEIKGPPAKAAFKKGQPTQAAEGFAKKQGVSIDDFEIRPTEKGEFVFIQKVTEGQPTAAVLQALIPDWIFKLEGKRFMRWSNGDLRFSRPIRWLVALLDDQILPLTLENDGQVIYSDRRSQVHRVLHPAPLSIPTAKAYVGTLANGFVMVDPQQRQQVIETQIQQQADQVQGMASIPTDLIQEVVHLVEWPTALVGSFEAEFLAIPAEVTITEMISHQRYFPVLNPSNPQELLPHFIAVSNGDPQKSDLIRAGNERVIRARLSDGQFFYRADQAIPLVQYLPKLETVTFQEDLGSMRSKADRIMAIAARIAKQLKLSQKQTQHIERAALLCKADLVTQMVGEFPELQGVMGEKYARASEEPEEVARAIAEHYQPRNAEDQLPQTLGGQVVAMADRLDTLVSIFGLGMKPSGSSDPFALRRSANAIVSIIWEAGLGIDLHQLIQDTSAEFSQIFGKQAEVAALQAQIQEFFIQRVRTLLQEDRRIDYDLVNAVLSEGDPEAQARALTDVLDVRDRAEFLQSLRQSGDLDQVFETVNRASRLAQKGELSKQILDPKQVIDTQAFAAHSEQAFYDALLELLPQTTAAQASRDYRSLVTGLAAIAPVVSQFFDGEDSVLVMAEDPQVRSNRLNLLGLLRNHARVLGDFGEIVKS